MTLYEPVLASGGWAADQNYSSPVKTLVKAHCSICELLNWEVHNIKKQT